MDREHTAEDGSADSAEAGQWEDGGSPDGALAEIDLFLDTLRRRHNLDFSGYKASTLSRRIRQRMQLARCADAGDYAARLAVDDGERETLCHDLLINVTEFFRDAPVFSLLDEEVLPDLLRGRDPSDDLRLWSAGCATGEEAYSLAMLALDAAGRFGFAGNVKVFATDVHPGVLAAASAGVYDDEAVRKIPEPLLRRFFQRDGARWRVDGTLRRHVVFARHNLLADPPFTRIDLAACRNLLIYLKPAAQLKALGQLHFALKPQGLLLLGASETVGEYEGRAFMTIDRSHKLHRRLAAQLPRGGDAMPGVVVPVASGLAPAGEAPAGDGDPALLEAELQATRERLQEMVLELQSSHERIDLANEELTASNEELQSTNEELQSVNEDLYALNAELEGKNSELAQLNRDYDHLLASAEIGTVFLDAGLHVRRFSPAICDYLSLRPQDAGRPIAEIAYRLGDPRRFLRDLGQVAATGERIEREVESAPGRWTLERMLPFRGEGGVRDGVVLTYTDISEVKTAHARADALAAERTHLQSILDALPDGVYIVNPEHDIQYLNPVLEREFGPPAGRKCYEYFHGRSSECDWCKNADVFAGRSVHWQWTATNGRTYDLFDMPFRNADGSVSKFEIFHDITRIRQSEQRLAEAAALSHVGHWQWNLGDGSLEWGAETCRIFGYAPEDFTPTHHHFLACIHADDRERVEQAMTAAIEQRRPYLAEFRFFRADGALRIGRATGHVELDGERPARLAGAVQDITGLRDIERALQTSEQLFSVAFRAAPHAASIARFADGRFIEANDKYEKYFGWKREEILGKSALDIGLWPEPATRRQWLDMLERDGTVLDYETTWIGRDGKARQVSLSAERIELRGEAHILAFIQDITERKEAAARIEYLAHHDALTGLPNRVLFRDRFALTTAWAERAGNQVALLFVDLDHFKAINDTLGHPAGDALLKLVAGRLRDCVRETDTISRLGGDEFLIAITDARNAQAVNRTSDKILEALARPFVLDGRELTNTVSIGIAVWPDDGDDFDTLLKKADTALYQAKSAGRNARRFYTERMNVDALERLQTRAALHRALDNAEFELHYQPQIDLTTKRVVGVEALLRWNRGGREMVPPARFIPDAEESGLIVQIGDWVLGEACAQAARWQAEGLPEMTVAVNLSAVQFRRGDLERSVLRALDESGLDPARLELELTESLLLDDAEAVLAAARRLKSLGVLLSIDDFGTGYSSLAYLKRFAVDKLKIDQSFVRDIASDPDDAAIVRAIVSMAHSLKLKVIAEGVETEDITRFLAIYHCDEAQGYFYARPMPAAALGAWLRDRAAG
ncbi:MAG: EAL domain-containing protein [Rhodocyclaceae bacterium]|nr:EAL domain-containing protein [Rhodocyclaceae bacterium]